MIECKHLSFSPFSGPRQVNCFSTLVYRGITGIPCLESVKKGVEKEKDVFKVTMEKYGEGNSTKVLRSNLLAYTFLSLGSGSACQAAETLLG